MKIAKLDLPENAINFLKNEGFSKLYPPQAQSIESGLLDGKSILVSAPTASGKTLIATMAMMGYLAKNSGKIVYLSPLRALASEKFSEFKKLEKIPIKKHLRVSISTGDFENADKTLEKSDILVLTNERMDSLIRHGSEWIDDIAVEEKTFVAELVKSGKFDEDEARNYLRRMLREASIYESKPGHYNRV